MSYNATVLRVAIASPSDVSDARDAVERALHSWNRMYSQSHQVVLLPWRWETHSVPLLGKPPQQVINDQGIDTADILIALFGSRLGMPTEDSISGTVEEIERSIENNRPVHLYFSNASLPRDVDLDQLKALDKFREEIGSRGLYGSYDDLTQLEKQIWAAVSNDVEKLLPFLASKEALSQEPVKFKIQSKSELLHPEQSNSSVAYWWEVTNIGSVPAENVTFEANTKHGIIKIIEPQEPICMEPQSVWRVKHIRAMGTRGRTLTINWIEDGEEKAKKFDVQ